MSRYHFETVDVFTERRFGGNPLAVFPEATGLSDAQMQLLAAELNLSETTFVLRARQPGNTARVRIFNRSHEMPFAGHPMVGTAFVLARGRGDSSDPFRFEVPAGIVAVRLNHRDGAVRGAVIEAPQPLTLGLQLSGEEVARCAGLAESDLILSRHSPVVASVGNTYVIAEVTPPALDRARPDLSAFRETLEAHARLDGRLSLYLYARGQKDLQARMFAPLVGTWEDPATGSAATPLAALLLSLEGGEHVTFDIHQGVRMGRPSLLRAEAYRAQDGIRARVGGSCVPVLSGEAEV